ncbi:riboflavin synthase [Planctomicrobium sp. SH661]|uniref:riboflavin synthase n=1 Tax=Planctomicrobium sp. SH661 TaxID=3448124 RepID=UPI003F5CA1BB
MFTGLIEGIGNIIAVEPNGPAIDLTLEIPESLPEQETARLGDSVALNGCCLTIVRIQGRQWTFQAGQETCSKTNLRLLQPGSPVNLERAVRPSDRLGGHFVQGHVDDVGYVEIIDQDGEWTSMWFRVPERLTRQMVSKGSITVDGVSLTLVNVENDRFSVALIPHTLQVTTLGKRQRGDLVNIETDVIGKYMEKMLGRS